LRHGDAIDHRLGSEPRSISVITASELLFGLARASDSTRARRQAFVEGVIAELDPLPVTTAVARVHADLAARLRAAGTPIGLHDLWIAATAIVNDLTVATGNVDELRRVPGFTVIDALAGGVDAVPGS